MTDTHTSWRAVLAFIVTALNALTVSANCGFGDGLSSCCDANDQNCIMVGIWMCSSQDTADCNCGSDPNTLMGGCSGGGAGDVLFRQYYLDVPTGGKICDTLGGWHSDDYGYGLSEQGNQAFGFNTGSIHFQVHPDDMKKVSDQSNVRVRLHESDYCVGGRAAGYEFYAWDGNNNQPGDWSLNGVYSIKSVRPFVYGDGSPPENGIGIKYAMFPFYHMGKPYDEINCQNDQYVENVGKGWYGSQDGCISSVDRIYCVEPEGFSNDGWGKNDRLDGLDYGEQRDTPKEVLNAGGYPMGSTYLGVYDANDYYRCNTNWWDFCQGNSQYGDPNDYCLVTRIWHKDHQTDDWDDQNFTGEQWLNIGKYLCDNNGQGFCYNSGKDDNSGDVCASSWLTDPSQNPLDQFPVQVGQMWTRILKC